MPEDKARILIVEDEAIEALDLQSRLANLGYPLPNVVHSGEDAVRQAKETCPDLVLMDIMLPGKIDGIQAAEQIRTFLDVPIIFLTAYADEKTLQRAKITEPYAYIVKPFQEKEVHIAIEMALYKHAVEKKLKESEKWFSTTLRSIGDAVIATDKDGRITFMNPIAEELTGWTQGEAADKRLAEVFRIINRDTRRTVEDPVAKVMREGAIVGLANHTVLLTKSGAEIPIDDRASPIRDDLGNLVGVVLIFRDVTERYLAERLKDEFIGMVSHEIKTPLTVIIGALQTAALPSISKEQFRELVKDAVDSADTLNDIVENLLELTRAQAGRLELHTGMSDFNEIACRVVQHLENQSALHRLTLDLPEALPAIRFDSIRIERILHNLVENAIKYSPGGGEVNVSAKQENSDLVVCVSDQGPGISAENQKRLFQSFERLGLLNGRAMQGVGLGLKVCRLLVEAHGGRIWVDSELGNGSAFCFTLPSMGAWGGKRDKR
ncbi:MAG: response regulator [Chloroflexi bacterium]|nr:response regulator [Chloroflexota bacterium]